RFGPLRGGPGIRVSLPRVTRSGRLSRSLWAEATKNPPELRSGGSGGTRGAGSSAGDRSASRAPAGRLLAASPNQPLNHASRHDTHSSAPPPDGDDQPSLPGGCGEVMADVRGASRPSSRPAPPAWAP